LHQSSISVGAGCDAHRRQLCDEYREPETIMFVFGPNEAYRSSSGSQTTGQL
jgi:hypothetical protein